MTSSFIRRAVLTGSLLPLGCAPAIVGDATPTLANPAPGALPVEPPIVCQEQHPESGTPIVVRGGGFAPVAVDIPNAPAVVLPDLALRGLHDLFGADAALGDVLYSGTASGASAGPNAALLSWQSEEQLTFVVKDTVALGEADGKIQAGLYDVTVTNADAQAATSALAFAVTERPAVATLAPPFTCVEQGARDIVVTSPSAGAGAGARALRVGESAPAVIVGDLELAPQLDGCQAVAHPGIDAELCASLTVEVAQAALPPGAHAVTIRNPEPAACSSTDVVELVVVPAPVITSVEPATVCDAEADSGGPLELTVRGSGFLRADGVDFTVTVGGIDVAVAPADISDCTPVAVVGATVETCDTFVISVDASAYPVGPVEIAVVNPAPADCSAATSALFEVLPSPRIDDVAPPTTCALDGGVDLAVSGDSFLRNSVDGVDFTVTVGGVAVVPTSIGAAGGCTPVVVQGVAMESCTDFVVNVDPAAFAGTVPSGDVDIAVVNPAPDGCATSRADLFEVLPSPFIASITPSAVCSAGAGVVDLAVSGADFLRVPGSGDAFAVSVAGVPVLAAAITGVAGCSPITVDGAALESCTDFVVTIDAGALPLGPVDVTVTNPAPDGCIGGTSAAFAILPPPTVTAVVPSEICSDVVASVNVQGIGLAAGTAVDFSGVVPDTVTPEADGSLTVTFNSGLPAGSYDVTVSNGAGCASTAPGALTVNPTPLVFFVDPPFIFNGIDFEATLFASAVDADVAAVSLIDAAGNVTPVTTFASAGRPERILATIEAGLTPGDYDVAVTSADGCPSALNGRLTITDQTTLTIDAVDPAFVSPTVPTAITVTTTGAGGVTFQNLPRVYLNPAAGGNAIALRAVELVSATQLTAVVTGAAADSYQLIVVNPTGEVGIAPLPVVVTVAEPPLVTSVAPASLDAGSISNVVINGANFDVTGSGPTVALDCRDFTTGADVPDGTVTVNVGASTSTALDVTVDGSGIPRAAVCVVIVTNLDNATFRFSAISWKNPAQNLNEFSAGVPMLEARRGLALAAGRPTETSRFLFAIGGDDGSVAGAKTTVEAVSIDAFGAMGAWSLQRNDLSNAFDAGAGGAGGGGQVAALPRTLAGVARVGRFIYVVGGDDGTGPVDTVLRAQILDPLAGPEVVDLDAALGDGVVGLPEGLFMYRVSALFPTSDASNPGGESLAGELFNVDVPAVADRLLLTLTWAAVPGASGYRVYRTPLPGQTPAELGAIAEVVGGAVTSFVDDNTRTVDPAVTPMPTGSLGVWHSLPGSALSIPRSSQATVAVAAPGGGGGQFFLYAVGGRSTGGTVVASGERATITVAADGSQSVSPFTPLSATLSPARAELVGLAVTGTDTPIAGNDTFLFFCSGRQQNGSVSVVVQGAAIDASGDIPSFANMQDPSPARVGSAGLAANGFLFLFGGQNGGASNSDVSSSLEDAAPTLSNWNNLGGGSTLVPRVFLSGAQESAFFFVGGGVTTGNVPTATIDQTVQ